MRQRIPGIVWLLIAGDGFASAFRFLVMPFLALYMHAATGATPAVVGLVIGLGAASNLVASFLLGPLSDRIGRKPSLIWGTLLQVLALAGFAVAHSLWSFALLQVLSGMVWALQGPAYMALLTDLTPEGSKLLARIWRVLEVRVLEKHAGLCDPVFGRRERGRDLRDEAAGRSAPALFRDCRA